MFEPNPWGFYQVHGNVWEWVEDCFNLGYREATTDGSAWTRGLCGDGLLRGGSWKSVPAELRSAYRIWANPGTRGNFISFRVARTFAP